MRIKLMVMALLLAFVTNSNAQTKKEVVLVTGSASGIGKATCERLIKEGYIVYGGDIAVEKNQYLDQIGGHAITIDVTKDDQVQAAVDRVIKEQGKIDVLFNNAGFGQMGTNEETTMEDYQEMFDINFYGYVRMVKAVLPHMRERKSGRIVNTTSMGGKIYFPLAGPYHATKHALEGWLDVLRLEVKGFNIKVVIIEPGLINTGFYSVTDKYREKYQKSSAYGHIFNPIADAPLPKMSEPDVIAKVVSKAISKKNPKTRYVKGKNAKMLIWMRKNLGDKMYDRIIMSQLK